MIKFVLLLVALLAAFGTPQRALGQDAPQPPQESPRQVYCPVTPEEEIDAEVFTEYEGKRVYFCCERCRARFLRNPERYATRLISTGAPVEKQPPAPPLPTQEPSKEPPTPPAHEPAPPQPAAAADHQHEEMPAQGGAEHSHASHEHGHGPRWINWIGRFHPAAVNLPIGGLTTAAAAEALFLARRRPLYAQVARFCVWFGVLSGALAGFLGWCFGGFHLADSDWLLTVHRWLGTGTVIGMVALLWATEQAHGEPARRVGLYRSLLFFVIALVCVTGFFGGAMVYGIDHYLKP